MARKTALLGAGSFIGKSLLERLDESGVALGELVLAEPSAESAVLAPVGEEFRASTPRVAEAVEGASLVLVAAPLGPEEAAMVRDLAEASVVIDLTGTLGGQPFDCRRPGADRTLAPGIHDSPTASTLLVAALCRSARAAGAPGTLAGVVLEPASEVGEEAFQELGEQAIAMLNFQQMPDSVHGRQAVHDVGSPGLSGVERERRIRETVARLDGVAAPSILVATPGTFHGVAVALRAEVDAAAWWRTVETERRLERAEDPAEASPAQVVRREHAVVGRIDPDGAGGAWAWAAADSLTHGSVGNVVDLMLATGGC